MAFIFDLLDSDQDNQISNNACSLENIPEDILNVLRPILEELEYLDEGEGSIDKSEFIAASLRLYNVSLCGNTPLGHLLLLILTIVCVVDLVRT